MRASGGLGMASAPLTGLHGTGAWRSGVVPPMAASMAWAEDPSATLASRASVTMGLEGDGGPVLTSSGRALPPVRPGAPERGPAPRGVGKLLKSPLATAVTGNPAQRKELRRSLERTGRRAARKGAAARGAGDGGGAGGAPVLSGEDRMRKQAEAERRFGGKGGAAQTQRRRTGGGSRRGGSIIDLTGAGDPTAAAASLLRPPSPLHAPMAPDDVASSALAASLGAATAAAGLSSSATLTAPWRRADHALSKRREASRWADPTSTTELETGLTAAAGEVTAAVGDTRHREDWSSAALHGRFRDESVRFEAWVQSREAAEEAAMLEEESGVVIPVAVAEPHPLWSWTQSLVARENATARKVARARALRKVYSLDVRAVWLAGDLPAEAPLPWRAAPYGAGAGGAPAGGRLSGEEVVARRALAGRRDDAALRSGHHQIQSVSLRRAMKDAVMTPVSEAAEVQRDVREAPERRAQQAEARAAAAAAAAAPAVVAVLPWFGARVELSHEPMASAPATEDGRAAEAGGPVVWRSRPKTRIASVRVAREVPLPRESLMTAPAAGAEAGESDEDAGDGGGGSPQGGEAEGGVVFFDEGRQVAVEDGEAEEAGGGQARSHGSEAKEEEEEGDGDGKSADGAGDEESSSTMLGSGRAEAVVVEATVADEGGGTRLLRARVPLSSFAEAVRTHAEAALPALEAAVADAEAAHETLLVGITEARERRADAGAARPGHDTPGSVAHSASSLGLTPQRRTAVPSSVSASGYAAAAAAGQDPVGPDLLSPAAGRGALPAPGSPAAAAPSAGPAMEDAWEADQSALAADEEATASAASASVRAAREAWREGREALSWAEAVAEAAAAGPGSDPEVVLVPSAPVLAADRAAATAHRRGHVAGVRGPDGDGAVRVAGASSVEPPAPPSGALRLVASMLQLVLAHEPSALPPRGALVREWGAATALGVDPGAAAASSPWEADAAGADAACGPGAGGVRSVGRFDDDGRTAGRSGEALAFAGAVWGGAEGRRARDAGLNPSTAEQTAVGLGGSAPWSGEAWGAVAEGGGALAGPGGEGEAAPAVGGRELAAHAVTRLALRGGSAALGPGGEAKLPPELTPAQLEAVAAGVSSQGAAALARAAGVGGDISLPAPHLRALSLALDPPLAAVLCGAAAGGLMAVVPGAAVIGRLDPVVAILSRDSSRSRSGHLIAVLAAAVDCGETAPAGVAEEMEGGADGARGLVPAVDVPAPEYAAVRPSLPVLLAAPSLLPSTASPNDWSLPPTITMLGDAASDEEDAPFDAVLPGHRRGGAAPERMPLGAAPRGRPAPSSQAEADAAPFVDGVPETATAPLGFRLWESVRSARPTGGYTASSFGVTRGSAVPNAPSLWPRRFTWHSTHAVRTGPTHTWEAFHYLLQNLSVAAGPNEATTFTSRMDFERCARVDSASLRSIRDLERRNEEHRAELRRRADEAARLERAAEAKARKARARAELARQWREKNIRDAARLRGSAPTLGLSEADWHAMRSAQDAAVTARHLGWERWVRVGPGAGEGEGGGRGGDVVAVWYYRPESGASGWDPPGGWPEEDALAADGASLEDAIRAAGAQELAVSAADLPEAAAAARREGRVEAAAAVSVSVLLGGGQGAGGDGQQDEPWLLPSAPVLSSTEAAAACEEVVVRALLSALRRWVAEAAARGCVDPGLAFKPPVLHAAGGREADPGDEDGSHAQRALDAASSVLAAGEARLDPGRRLRRRQDKGRSYDDGDVASMDCGLEPGTGGEGRASAPWRAGQPSDRFDVGSVFLFLDRDGDGVVSARDWAVLLAGGRADAGGSGAGAGDAPSVRSLPASDRVAGEVVRAGLWPYFRAALGRMTPPALRPLLATRVPSLVDEDAVKAAGGTGGGGTGTVTVSEAVRTRLERGRDPDGADTGRDAASLLSSVLTPSVRLRAFRALKRQQAFFPRAEDRDKRPQHLRHDELVRWLAAGAEGAEWFGVATVTGLHSPVAGWAALSDRQAAITAAAEWVPAVDPASGDTYFSSALTGASVWEKGAPQLQAEAALRRSVVALVDTDVRSEEALYRSGLRRALAQSERLRRRAGGPADSPGEDDSGEEDDGESSERKRGGARRGRGQDGGAITAESVAAALATDDGLLRALAKRLGLPEPAGGDADAGAGVMVPLGAGAREPDDAATADGAGRGGTAAPHEDSVWTTLPGAALGPGEDDMDEDGELLPEPVVELGRGLGMEWRQLRPPKEARRLRARAKESHVLGAERSAGLNAGNTSRVVGLVAPRDVTVAPTVVGAPRIDPVLLTDLAAAASEAGLRMTVDPRTGERVVDAGAASASGGTSEADDKRAKETAVREAFLHVGAGKLEALRDVLVTGMVSLTEDRDDAGNTLFIRAAQNGNKRLCKELLRKGSDINARNGKGNTALHYCFAYGFHELGEYLVEKGADDTIANSEGVAPREGLTSASVAAI